MFTTYRKRLYRETRMRPELEGASEVPEGQIKHISLSQELFRPIHIENGATESTPLVTAKAIRLGIFALMRPVITLTEGLCVAIIRCIPAALASCASLHIASSTSFDADHHKICKLVNYNDNLWHL
jgi:hypothetical protein